MHHKKYIIIDIGTHKLEELKVLFSPGHTEFVALLAWSMRRVAKAFVSLQTESLRTVVDTIRMFFKARNHEAFMAMKFVCVEPNVAVCEPMLRDFRRRFDVDYFPVAILGHNHHDDFEIVGLNCYENTLSSSIYNKQNSCSTRQLACLSFKFSVFLDLLRTYLHISPDDEIILRVNCEGAELGIVRAVRESGLRVRAIFGSLADVKKIHGEDEYNEMLEILSELGINYHYFVGSNPATWLEAFKSPSLGRVIYKL